MPDSFIPVMEKTGLIDELTAQVFDQSLEWFSQSFPQSKLMMSLNLSAKSLVDIHLADHLAILCQHFRSRRNALCWNLTETSAMVDPILSLDLMTRNPHEGLSPFD